MSQPSVQPRELCLMWTIRRLVSRICALKDAILWFTKVTIIQMTVLPASTAYLDAPGSFPNITSLFRIAMVVGDPKKLGSLCLLWSCFLAGPLFISRWNARSTVKTCRNCRYSWSMCAGWSMYRHLQDESTWSPATELVWGGKKRSVAVGNGFSKSYWLHTRNDPKPEKELGSLGSCIFGNYAAQLSKGMMFW